jgi:thiosulfate/3-mercaptopyruvate sulfurtransferase
MRERRPFQRIGVAFARTLLDRKETLVLDMRDTAAFETAHVERARRLVQSELETLIASVDSNRPILIYCYRGKASLELAQTFSDFGFQEVYSLEGGYNAWATGEVRTAEIR